VSDAGASPMRLEGAARGELDAELERERGAAATKTRSPLDSARIYTKPTEAGEEAGVSAQGGAADTPARLARATPQGGARGRQMKRGRSGKKKQTARERLKEHRRWAHARGRRLRRTASCGYVDGLVFDGDIEVCDCSTCMRKNARKAAFKKQAYRRSTKRAYRIHSDLKEFPVRSKRGYKYSICFVCGATRRGKAYSMRKKDEALEMFKRFIAEECEPKGFEVKILRSDNGGEYIAEEFEIYCRSKKIDREYSPPHGQSADGVSENYWREVARSVRAILWDQQRDDDWWPGAMDFANEVRNHLDCESVDRSGIPEVEWTGASVDVSHWRVPLSTSWSYIEKGSRAGGTLGDQRERGVLVGYASNSRCYEVLVEDSNLILNRRYEDVIVDEKEQAPTGGRRQRTDLAMITEETVDEDGTVIDMGKDSSSDEEGPTKRAKQATGGAEDLAIHTSKIDLTEHCGDGFYRTKKVRSVKHLAEMFTVDPQDYLRLLRQYDGWYQKLTEVSSQVAAGSHVPVPQDSELVRSSGKEASTGSEAAPRKTPTRKNTATASTKGLASGRSTAGATRRSRRIEFLHKEAEKDAAAMLALAADFERQATAATKGAPMGQLARPARQQEASAFFVAGHDGDDGFPIVSAAKTGKALLTEWAAFDDEINAAMLYDDEPQDQVYYQALAAGEILLDPHAPVPKTQKKAHSGAHREAWLASEDREWTGLWKKGAFEDVAYTGQRLHHLLWVYKVKSSGLPKSRLCADGRQQDPATYGDIASPTMRMTSFRLLLAVAALKKWGVWADDVAQAFLEAKRPEDKPLWASYPSGYDAPPTEGSVGRSSGGGAQKRTRCLLVLRQLYGLHDAPMGFFMVLQQHLVKDQGFIQSLNDRCLFVKYKAGSDSERKHIEGHEPKMAANLAYHAPETWGDIEVAVTVHVDDIASTGEDKAVGEYRKRLHERFPCTGGPITEYYGLDVGVDRKRGVVRLRTQSYIGRMLHKLGITTVPKTFSPMDPDLELPKLTGECKQKALHARYRTVVGSVLHAAVTARPDVAEAARCLSSHLQHPCEVHLKAALRVVYYLATTRELALTYGLHRNESGFYGTSDASHATESGAKGVTGWAFHLAGGAVAWKARTQSLVALSSTEAELIAVDEAARELRYLEKVLADLGIKAPRPTPMGQDNMSAISIVGSTHFNPRSRHIALRYHSTGDMQRAGVLQVRYLPTEHIPSDALTKGLPRAAHQRHTLVLLGISALKWDQRVHEKKQQQLLKVTLGQ
jgi:hypothetical protein